MFALLQHSSFSAERSLNITNMKKNISHLFPYLLILFGLIILFQFGQGPVAGVFVLIGIVMVVESIWPEKWGSD